MAKMRRTGHLLVLAAAVVGTTAGMVSAAQAQTRWYQCYSLNGSGTCDVCGGDCLGANYLCCGGETELQ